jgi:hypothetical protein
MSLTVAAPAANAAKVINGFRLEDTLVPARHIRSGGPPRDGIPALLNPRFVSAEDADFISADDRVLGVTLDGVAKAYPIKILNYHEIVNDRFEDRAIAVTFCPLCGTGIVFDAIVDGQDRTFGVSGLLYNSDVLMYDRESESLWSQMLAQAISGPAKGLKLRTLPARHTTWSDWVRRSPQTLVLVPPQAYGRDYSVDPYLGYADSNRVWFPVAHHDKRYPAKEVVVGLTVNSTAKAYPFAELPPGAGAIEDQIAETAITLEFDQHTRSARILTKDGREIPTFTAYWFAWIAFHPDTLVYTAQNN